MPNANKGLVQPQAPAPLDSEGKLVRATLAQHDGLAFSGNSARIAHTVTLCQWIEGGYLSLDMDFGCFRLTRKGRAALRAAMAADTAQPARPSDSEAHQITPEAK